MHTAIKSVLAITAIAGLTIGLSACGSGSSGNDAAAPNENPAKVSGTLRVLTPSYPASSVGETAFNKVVAAFNKDYPKVKVEPDFATFGNLTQKIATSVAGGTGYDVIVTGSGFIQPLAARGAIADLKPYGVTEQSLAKSSVSALLPTVTYKDSIYAIPLLVSPKPLALSKSKFIAAGLDPSKPPASWAELEADAKKLTKTDSSGKITQAGFDFWAAAGSTSYRQDYTAFLGSLGKDLYTKAGKSNFDNADGVKALTFMNKLINTDKVVKYGQASTNGSPLVTTGQAAMGFAGGYVDCKALTQAVCDDLEFFNLKETNEATFSGGHLASVGSSSKLKGAAFDFIQKMSSLEAETDMAALNFAIPATAGAADSATVKSNPASAFAYANLDKIVFEGGASNWLDLRDVFVTKFDQVLVSGAEPSGVLASLSALSK